MIKSTRVRPESSAPIMPHLLERDTEAPAKRRITVTRTPPRRREPEWWEPEAQGGKIGG